ncbi:MAG TPA: hypothetical protein VF731_02525 [Solirubrobacterales bacterium]
MEGVERDDTQDWLLPAGSAPPLMSELESRVDEALRIARASEAAVMTVGAAAIDAAEQARRAAELAEQAARSAEAAATGRQTESFPATEVIEPLAPTPEVSVEPEPEPAPPAVASAPPPREDTAEREVVSAPVEDSFERFVRRADCLLTRLREIDPAA